MSKFGGFYVVSMEGVRIVSVEQKKNPRFLFGGGAKGKSIKDLYFMIVYEPKGDVCSSCLAVWYTVTSVCTVTLNKN